MAKRASDKPVPRAASVLEGEYIEIPDGMEAPPPDAELDALLAQLGETGDSLAKVMVYRERVEGGRSRREFLYECPPSEFQLPALQETYGAGDYRVTVYGTGSTGRTAILSNKLHSVGMSRAQIQQATLAAALPAAPAPALAPATDPAALAQVVAAALAQPLSALVETVRASQTSRGAMLGEMEALARILRPAEPSAPVIAPAAPPMVGPMETFRLAKEMAGFLSGRKPDDDGDGAGGVIEKALGAFLAAMTAAQARQGQAQPVAAPIAPPAAPAQPVAPGASAAFEETEDDEVSLMLKLMLIAAKRGDMDEAPAWGERVYEAAPDEMLEALALETWWQNLLAVAPAFGAYRPWCEKVREEVLRLKAEDAQEPPKGDGASTG